MDVTIDASGSDGHNASNGTDGITHDWLGYDGDNGGWATEAGSGSNGGNIQVTLSSVTSSNESGHINISGTKTYSNGHVEYINNDYHLGKTGLIYFISRGGRGGNGGIGGQGSSGGNGGDGGHIKISVSKRDAHLLMLIGDFDVSGGDGGDCGYHGSGGRGGEGGRGGYSHDWTETIPTRPEVQEYLSNNALTTYMYNSNYNTSNRSVDATMYWRKTKEIDHYIRPSYTKTECRYNYESGMYIGDGSGSSNALTTNNSNYGTTMYWRKTEEIDHYISPSFTTTEYQCDYESGMYIGDGSGSSNALTRYNEPPVEYLSSEEIKCYDRPEETDIHYHKIDELRLHGRINPDYDSITFRRCMHGGIDGDNGYDGHSPTGVLNRGSNGSCGTFEYGVINKYGVWERRDEFCELQVNSATYETQNNYGIIEPGSSIKVGIKIVNKRCPIPNHTPIRIELNDNNEWINNCSKINASLNLLNDQKMTIKVNDPKIVNDGTPLFVPINLNKFKATMAKFERPVQIIVRHPISFVIQQPINISEVISIHSPGGLQYEVFWFVNNISNLDFGQDSQDKRLVRTILTRGESNYNEIDNQEIKYLKANGSIQITSKLLLDQNNNEIQKFTVTLQIGNSFDQPNNLESIQTRKFTIQPPLTKNIPHLFLDVTKNDCSNLNGSNVSLINDNGLINLSLSRTNQEKYSVKGLIKFGNGTTIELNHDFNFGKNAYIYITQKISPKQCDVNLTTYENESHIFALIANTFDDRSNKINWNFQTINRINNKLNKYSTPFKLRVDQFTYYIENDTKIFEPNCKGFIEKITVFNEGEMPPPNNQNINISLSPTSNIIPDNSFFNITESISCCNSFELENNNLKFSIKNNENGLKNKVPLRIKDHITFNTVIKSINHSLQNFNNFPLQEITIQYPIEMGEYLGYRNPSANEECYSLFWKIKNISNIEFGKISEVGRLIVTSLDNNTSDNRLFINEIESLMSGNHSLVTTKVRINDNPSLNSFSFKLLLGSIESPKILLPIQSYPFHLLPLLREDAYKKFDLVFDLNAGRLSLNNQPNDYIKPGNFQLTISTPKSNNVKVGDVEIRGELQYTNEWIIKIHDQFSLDSSGWIHLYTNGRRLISQGSINIKIAQEDTHLLYLIDQSCLEKCNDQLYQVIDNSEKPVSILQYHRIYQFTLVNYDCIPEDDGGIYEPGGRIVIRGIEVKNTGDMPTPTSYDVEISVNLLSSSEISLPKDNRLKLPKHIESSEKKILNQIKNDDEVCLEFQINQQSKASNDKPLNILGMVNLRAVMFGIHREIINFTLPKQFNIQYPIQICPNTKIQDIPYKNITRITWRLNNISQIDFGSNSNIKRVIKVQVKIEKMSPKNSLKFKTNQGLKNTFEQEISLLEAQQSRDMFCELVRTLKNKHSTVIDANLSITLYIGSIELPDREFDIEIRNKYIEIFPSYESNSDSDFLLVANSNTTKNDVVYWDNLCQNLGLSMSIWNIRRQGHLDLFESNLIKDYSSKSIVILNDELNEGKFNHTIDYLDPLQFFQAVNNHDIKFFINGTNIDDQRIKNLFIPKDMIKSEYMESYVKIKCFMENMTNENSNYGLSKEKNAQNISDVLVVKCINTNLRPGGENKLQKLSKFLQKIYPGHRHIIITIIGKNSHGNHNDQIILCETTNRTKQYLTYNSVQNINQIDGIIKVGLLFCIPFSKRIDILQQILFIPAQDLDQKVLKNLIEADLAMELNGLLCGLSETSKKMKFVIQKQLELFNRFCEFVKFIVSEENSIDCKQADWALSVIAKLKILIHYSESITSSSERLKKIIYDKYLEAFKKYNNQDLLHCLRIKVKHVKKNWKEKFQLKYTKKEKLNLFRDYMLEILKVNNLKTDYELLNNSLDIILSEEDYKIIEQNHKETSDKIERKKYEHQKQIELLERQVNFENMDANTRDIGSEDINVLFNHGIEADNCGSEDITEITNQGSEAFNFGSEDSTMIMNQGIEVVNYGNNAGSEV